MRSTFWVVVLGDYGRSPRMQYHTDSLLKHGNTVHVVAYDGSEPIQSVAKHAKFCFHSIPPPPSWSSRLPRVLALVFKALFQIVCLLWSMLCVLPHPDGILVQLPPSIPTLMVVWLVGLIRECKLIFDWHNFGFTIMGLTMGSGNWLVRCARKLEMVFGRAGHRHFCVCKAMKDELEANWGIDAVVLYDRPPDRFKKSSVGETHALMCRLSGELETPMHASDFCSELVRQIGGGSVEKTTAEESILTVRSEGGGIELKENRPAVVVSSTSWTPDEDFSILLNAAEIYNSRIELMGENEGGRYPRLLFFVTGKGPLKQTYVVKMKAMNLRHVAFRTAWLEQEDYPVLLGSADLGISLHTSSSGLDLPMKVVDMFGCKLPVCAIAYSCIHELVDDKRGLLFSNSEELAEQMLGLFNGFNGFNGNGEGGVLGKIRRELEGMKEFSWESNWNTVALPVLQDVVG